MAYPNSPADFRGLGAQVVGDGVGGHDLDLARHHPRTDEVSDLFEDVGENIVGDLGVAGVHTDYYRRSIWFIRYD